MIELPTGRAEVLLLAAALMPSVCKKFLQNNPFEPFDERQGAFIAQSFLTRFNPLMEDHHGPTNSEHCYGVVVFRIHHYWHPLPYGRPWSDCGHF
jgi:hypothetical protein